MTQFLKKLFLYILLILVVLEIIVRVFHLYSDVPLFYIDEFGVEKRVPRNYGYAVYGNRNQSFSEYGINNAGFNSHRDFLPTENKFEVAIIGDSFIEGFHQDYTNSIGRKIEEQIPGIEVYEYGYAGYDLANQLYLINAYKNDFALIDEIIIYLKYDNDLRSNSYAPNSEKIRVLNSKFNKYWLKDNIKLLDYITKIGVYMPLKKLVTDNAFAENGKGYKTNEIGLSKEQKRLRDLQYLDNFKSLVSLYGFDKGKTTLLLDSKKTSELFLKYCKENKIRFIDYSQSFAKSKKSTTLIYDHHWNDHGRDLIAQAITIYLSENHSNLNLILSDNEH